MVEAESPPASLLSQPGSFIDPLTEVLREQRSDTP
jgi:hypothetical protein